jgi:thiamine pyrophosphokinase
MKCIIMANGEYGNLTFYAEKFSGEESILCADGGANYAYRLGWQPAAIIGDMDSILPEVKQYFVDLGVPFRQLSRRKDETDTQVVLNLAVEMGASEIIMLGTLGKRLDHTLANLYSGIDLLQKGIKVSHLSPQGHIYLVNKEIEIQGEPGQLVSIISLADASRGVTISGFEYPLDHVCLENRAPYAISNVLTEKRGVISLQEGVLAVFHYFSQE